jgi:glycosyltransferase involved in cell wall biosynthesis
VAESTGAATGSRGSTAPATSVMLVVPWDQEVGGVASVVGNLARELEKSGHRVVFLHPGHSDRCRRRRTAWGFTGYELNLRAPLVREHPVKSLAAFVVYCALTLYRIASVIRAHRVQVVNVHYPVDLFVYLAVLRWLLPIRLVVSVHGADLFRDGRRRERYSWSLRLLLSSADALVAPSKAFLRECLVVFPKAVKNGVVILNGVDIDELATPDAERGAGERAPYLLCIAAHNEKKALDVLITAFAEISGAYRGLRLLMVGDGPLRRQHEEQARSLSLEQRVVFLGKKGRSEVARLLHGCSIFVLPSRSEPFAMVVTEALACRKPVVASAVGGIPEIIEDGHSGVLVEPDNPGALARALVKVLDNHAFYEGLAAAGYATVRERFGCGRMGAEYGDLYSALVAGHVKPAGLS